MIKSIAKGITKAIMPVVCAFGLSGTSGYAQENFGQNQPVQSESGQTAGSNLEEKLVEKAGSEFEGKSLTGTCKEVIKVYRWNYPNPISMPAESAVESAVVTGWSNKKGQAYQLMRFQNGSAIVGPNNTVVVDTKNTGKLLEAYYNGLAIRHNFYEHEKFKYAFFTRDGKNILDFIGYDPSSRTLLKSMSGFKPPSESTQYNIGLCLGSHENSAEFDAHEISKPDNDIFFKIGQVNGTENSSFKRASLFELGEKAGFGNESSFFNLKCGFFGGWLHQDVSVTKGQQVFGAISEMSAGANIYDKLNAFSAISLAAVNSGNVKNEWNNMFHEEQIGAGVSYDYKLADPVRFDPQNDLFVKPYLICQFKAMPYSLASEWDRPRPMLTELGGGIVFDMNLGDASCGLDLNLLQRPWEREFGARFCVKEGLVETSLNASKTISDYWLCPDRKSFGAELNFNIKGILMFGIDYQQEQNNYPGDSNSEKKGVLSMGCYY